MSSRPSQITEDHLRRRAVVYIRQSTAEQVRENIGSTALQRELTAFLEDLGWQRGQIDVLDDDLGISGSVPSLRHGFQRLLEQMKGGGVGIVAAMNESRLGRNMIDLAAFASLARRHNVLLAIGSQIFDFKDPNSEFVGFILSLNAVRENRTRVELSRLARRKKAEAGIATTRPPIGYVSVRGGAWAKDPGPRVREAIQLIFDKFLELGTLGRVVRYLRRMGILLPARGPQGHLRWVEATRAALHRILRNPAYAGIYVYGKTVADETGDPDSRGRTRQVPRPPSDWICVKDHHEPYILPHQWEEIQQRLTANQNRLKVPAGRGEALLQGLLRCTRHGLRLRTGYPTRKVAPDGRVTRLAVYRCQSGDEAARPRGCTSAYAYVVDADVESELLRTLTPPSIEVIRQVSREALREHETLIRQRQEEVRRAEYVVSEAERAFDAAEGHPHLQRRLAQRLEDALRRRDELRTTHELHPLIPPLTLDEAEVDQLRCLLGDLPRLWRHPKVTSEQRKRIIRSAIREILVTPQPGLWDLEIQWVGGAKTHLELLAHRGVKELIQEAYQEGRTPAQIAALLNDRGVVRRTGPYAGAPYTEQAVRWLIRNMRLQNPYDHEALLHIRARYEEGATGRMIAEELNSRGIRHYLGAWTRARVWNVVARLRKGTVPGVQPLPKTDLSDRVRTLHEAGLSPGEIAARLREEGARSKRRQVPSVGAVRYTLQRLGLRSNSTMRTERLLQCLKEWAPTMTVREITRRANDLGFRTRTGRRWTENVMNRRLADLGLRVPPKRRPKRGPAAPVP